MGNRQEIYCDDCLNILPQLNNITAVATDPPYGLGFMGKKWDYGIPGVEYWQAIKEVCLPGAWLLAFGGTRTFHRLAVAIEDAGWQIRDIVMWVYGSGFPKSHNIGKAVDKLQGNEREVIGRYEEGSRETARVMSNKSVGFSSGDITKGHSTWEPYGTQLKPAWEPIIVAQKPIEKTYAENALKYGIGGLNIDECRVGNEKHVVRGGGQFTKDGEKTFFPSKEINEERTGRFPANLIHDGSDEVLELFPETESPSIPHSYTRSTENMKYGKGLRPKGSRVEFDNYGDSGSAARFFYCAKASKSERTASNNHPTVKPLALMRYLLTLVKQPENNLILDPFMGSGSTLVAAKQLDLPAIGIDNDEQSCEIARNRLANFIL